MCHVCPALQMDQTLHATHAIQAEEEATLVPPVNGKLSEPPPSPVGLLRCGAALWPGISYASTMEGHSL